MADGKSNKEIAFSLDISIKTAIGHRNKLMRKLGLEPDSWQIQVLEGSHERLLLNCCRQAGKSTAVAMLGLVEARPVKFFGAQATGCSPISTAVKAGNPDIDPQKPSTIARSLAIGNPADGHYAIKVITKSGGWSEDVSDPELVECIQLLAETEGVFTETAGGVTVGTARKLYNQGRISPDETTVLCITGNGLKTTDALAGKYQAEEPIAPKVAEFEKYMEKTLNPPEKDVRKQDVPEPVGA